MAENLNSIYEEASVEMKSIKTPLLSDNFSQKNPLQWPLNVHFPGWRKPERNWCNWVEKLSLKFAKTWQQTGICDGILSSLYEIKPNPDIVLGLCEFWCPETNTFIFPWGEATITLEDVTILAGFPVFEEPVNSPLLGDSTKILLDEKLNGVSVRVSYSKWIKYFNEVDSSFEHVGFLAYWLSRFVFPDLNERDIGKHVFPIAISLSVGEKVCIASSVLACLYQNLTFLGQNAYDCYPSKKEVSLPGPFWILQIWALERFPLLGSQIGKPLCLGHLRIARWDKVVVKESLVSIRSTLKLGDGFLWCPYALPLENWRYRSIFYPVNELTCSDCSAFDDEELKSFWVCLRPQKLIGIECREIYSPQRVLLQFGYEYNENKGRMIAPWSFSHPQMSERYKIWCHKSTSDCLYGNSKASEQEGSDHIKPTLATDLVKPNLNYGREFLLKGLEQEDSDHNKNSKETENLVELKLSLNNEDECSVKYDSNSTLTGDIVKSDSNYEGENLLNAVETGTPRSVILDVMEDGNCRKRKFNSGRRISSSKIMVFVNLLDEEEDEKLGTVDNPLYISDDCKRISRKARKAGNSLQNPIDTENYYF